MRAALLVILIAACGALAACQHAAAPRAAGLAPGARPNILLITADDLGYQDLGVFGSEIRTPNIDALAASGLIMTSFYTSPMCAPTRAMLMSGMDNHRAGVGAQGGAFMGRPGYEGYLDHRLLTVAERLSAAGYHTYMAGKWHLGIEEDQSPTARGFERAFALLDGGASHFSDMVGLRAGQKARYRDDGVMLESLPEDFYSTIAYTDRMIGYIDEGLEDGRPFFGWLSYTAPHWPMQVPPEDLARWRGRYDEGYDVLRRERFERWKALGYGPPDAELPPDPVDLEPWESLSPEERAASARTMEIYAAMVERMDAEIGRVLAHLAARGALENTLVIFMSDNGAEGTDNDVFGHLAEDNSLENIGRRGSFALIEQGWAEAGSAPYYLRKVFATEGGTRVPFIVSAPDLGVPRGRTDALASVMDLTPTFLELAGAPLAPEGAPTDLLPISGRSLAGVLRGEPGAVRAESDALAWELHGHRSIRRGDWKAEWVRPPQGPGRWQLFDLAADPSQRTDLAAARPEILAELAAAWDRYAEANGVIVMEEQGGAE